MLDVPWLWSCIENVVDCWLKKVQHCSIVLIKINLDDAGAFEPNAELPDQFAIKILEFPLLSRRLLDLARCKCRWLITTLMAYLHPSETPSLLRLTVLAVGHELGHWSWGPGGQPSQVSVHPHEVGLCSLDAWNQRDVATSLLLWLAREWTLGEGTVSNLALHICLAFFELEKVWIFDWWGLRTSTWWLLDHNWLRLLLVANGLWLHLEVEGLGQLRLAKILGLFLGNGTGSRRHFHRSWPFSLLKQGRELELSTKHRWLNFLCNWRCLWL